MTETDFQIQQGEWEGMGMSVSPSIHEVQERDVWRKNELRLQALEIQHAEEEGMGATLLYESEPVTILSS